MTRQRIRPLLPLAISFALLVILTLAVSCSAPVPAPQQSESFASSPGETYPKTKFDCTRGEGYDTVDRQPSGFWMKNELIVTGSANQVYSEIDRLFSSKNIRLILLEKCIVSSSNGRSMEQAAEVMTSRLSRSVSDPDLARIVTRLYRYDRYDDDLGDVPPVYELAQMLKNELLDNSPKTTPPVFFTPNYLTGVSGASSCADPQAIEKDLASMNKTLTSLGKGPVAIGGSPFSVGDSPFSVGDSPYSGRGDNAAPSVYRHQWALTQTIGAAPASIDTRKNENARVYIFDTSPYPPTSTSALIMQEGMAFPLSLTLHTPVSVSSAVATSPVVSGSEDHGLFVAGLVHLVAPDSEIHLVRTLNDYGCGDLFTLGKALSWFLWDEHAGNTSLDDVALNLSLGINAPSTLIDLLSQAIWLRWNIEVIHARGATIVAASGNDSGQVDLSTGNSLTPAQFPAGYPSVIGVAATNKSGARTCYSNPGDVAAPGGDGYSGPGKKPGISLKCVPYAGECSATGSGGACDYGLVSLVMTQTVTDTGFAYWAGTSFAAPLVTGMTARKIAQKMTAAEAAGEVKDDACPPANGDAALGAGVVHNASVAPCPTPESE